MEVEKAIKKLLEKVELIEAQVKQLKIQDTHYIYNEEKIVSSLQKVLKSHERNNKLDILITLVTVLIVVSVFTSFSLYYLAE